MSDGFRLFFIRDTINFDVFIINSDKKLIIKRKRISQNPYEFRIKL